VRLGHGAVVGRAGDGDLELAGQELELRVVGGPLAQKLRDRARVRDLVGGSPAKWSAVTLRTQFPEVWIACIPTSASASRMSGTSRSRGQLNWMFCRVVKWP
jgi:hypothetical protein